MKASITWHLILASAVPLLKLEASLAEELSVADRACITEAAAKLPQAAALKIEGSRAIDGRVINQPQPQGRRVRSSSMSSALWPAIVSFPENVKQRDDLVSAFRYAVMMRRQSRTRSECDAAEHHQRNRKFWLHKMKENCTGGCREGKSGKAGHDPSNKGSRTQSPIFRRQRRYSVQYSVQCRP